VAKEGEKSQQDGNCFDVNMRGERRGGERNDDGTGK
jgi:hypothetical protein